MRFLSQLLNYLQTTLIPNRVFLKTRLADITLYFCGLAWISLWTTIIDSILLDQSIPFVIWFILHFIFIAIAVLLYLLFVSYLNRWLIQWLLPKPWAFRQVFPYTVAANIWTFPIGVLFYQLGATTIGISVLLGGHILYSVLPLVQARKKKNPSKVQR
ncbi:MULTISPECIES: hypothetical protein [Exiguobacterium]|uniref:hypothetical protein n=1 Tax=Exiguobacterium TaxID=33986 RepID=UPI001F3486AA|nr:MULTISPECIES: hypothetical protein [Exiguobacterium]MCT4781505.1 hypothetical protein [Exiguobacterium soli]